MRRLLLVMITAILCLPPVKAQDSWVLKAGEINKDNYYGVSVGNGMLGLISSAEPLKLKEVVLAGLYDCYGNGRVATTVSTFNLLDMRLAIGWQDVTPSNVSNFTQQLDMRNGAFTGSFDFKDIASVKYIYYALRQLPHTVMLDVTVKAHKKTAVLAENIMQTPAAFRDNRNYYNEVNPAHAYIPLLTTVAQTPSGNATVVASNTFVFPEKHGEEPKVLHEMRNTDSHLMQFTRNLEQGEEYTFSLIGNLLSSEHVADPYNQAERLAIYANLQGHDALLAAHNQAWEELWKSDIIIEGDEQVQQDIHSMMYHLYSFVREGTNYSLSPMGLSGLGYMGHVFWDTEIWMYPSLLLLHPEIAKGLIEYRYQRLEAAKQNAFLHGYKGAMYPWESAASGEEETPVWALSGPYEHHITADVAIAAWNYYLVTRDKDWLKEKGLPILQNTAAFWESRVTPDNGKYEIKNVVCADEWAENVDNNAYTNATAKLNLEYANEAARTLGLPVNRKWKEIADNLVFVKMENGVTREHDTYTGQSIKQADANLLAYPLKVITDQTQISKDLKYYQDKVPHANTPAMTQAIFSLLYSRLGDGAEAYKWFKDAYEQNLLPPFRVVAETKGGTNPYFITGAGGVLQTVMMGFAGLDISAEGGIKQIKSVMPPHWKKLTITGVGTEKKTYTVTNK